MSKRVILKIERGCFEQGFPVTLQIGEEQHQPSVEVSGRLPPAPEVLVAYTAWQSNYTNLGGLRRIKVRPSQTANRSFKAIADDCQKAAEDLETRFKAWLCTPEFRPIRERWLEELQPQDEVRVILQSPIGEVQRLPWHLWDVLERYPKAEIALCSEGFKRLKRSRPFNKRVKILAILGDSQGINPEKDRELLQQLPNADVTFLVQPALKELNDQLWDQPWDILFFAGHSSDEGKGELSINPTQSLTVDQLKHALRIAVANGLQLAILNSCQGLKLAQDLADLHIPQTILMREQVPDLVAQEFLKHFLTTFANGASLYLSVRSARERLQGLEDQYLCATWLPVIYQNPAQLPPTWASLKRPKANWVLPLMSGAIAAIAVLGVRHTGFLQPLELKAYDQMVQLRSVIQPELPDNRIVVIEITDQDYAAQKERQEKLEDTSLSDASLVRLLNVLNKYQPRVIGLDLFRDAKDVSPDVQRALQQTPNLIGICKSSSSRFAPTGIAPPVGIPSDRIGFNDVPKDPDGVVRRMALKIYPEPNSACSSQYSISFQIALHYLRSQGIHPQWTPENNLQLGPTLFNFLNPIRHGAYQTLSDLNVGYQLVLNYRASNVLPISLTDVLNDQQPLAIKDRIVIIGSTRKNPPMDTYLTPYDRTNAVGTDGVFIISKQVSQIISAVLDNRPLIWVWPWWGETLWIAGWAIGGAFLVRICRSPWSHGTALLVLVLGVWGICVISFTQGGWIPLVPPVIVLILSTGGVSLGRFYMQQTRQ